MALVKDGERIEIVETSQHFAAEAWLPSSLFVSW